MTKLSLTILGVVIEACILTSAWGAEPTPLLVPHTFIAGTPARAAEVNENFDAVESVVNDNQIQTRRNRDAISALNASAAASASKRGTSTYDFTAALTNIDSLTVNFPDAGTVLFSVTGFMGTRAHTNGTSDQIYCLLVDPNTDVAHSVFMALPAAFPTYSEVFAAPLSISLAIPVSSAGTITINLNCKIYSGGGGANAFIQNYEIQAIYVPNSLN